jgi:hypothetical protein
MAYVITGPTGSGTPGPAGPAGPTGATGTAGAAGATGSTGGPINLVALTANYTVLTADSGKYFSNLTAAATLTIQLPATPAIGFTIGAISAAANAINFNIRAGVSDRLQTPVAVTVAGGALTAASSGRTQGCVLVVAYVGGNVWNWFAGYPYDWNAIA